MNYVTTGQAAKLLNCSRKTVWKYINNGLLRAIKIGNNHLIPIKDVQNFVKPKNGRPPLH